jgi:hypothetical protein
MRCRWDRSTCRLGLGEEGYDIPDSIEDQLSWLTEAGFDATVTWESDDLAVLIADASASVATT